MISLQMLLQQGRIVIYYLKNFCENALVKEKPYAYTP